MTRSAKNGIITGKAPDISSACISKSMFHKEILTAEQKKLLPLIRKFKRSFYLVGGTAIALYIGHRRSIDFDLFTTSRLRRKTLEERIRDEGYKFKTLHQTSHEWTFFIGNVKITFYQFLYPIKANIDFDKIIKIPSLVDLAAMRAYALGDRAKWKDYVDLYFIFKNKITLTEISKKAEQLFGGGFNERLFREQLAYYDDINYEEEVEFLLTKPSKAEIKKTLTQIALH